jgi:hypothetical protein
MTVAAEWRAILAGETNPAECWLVVHLWVECRAGEEKRSLLEKDVGLSSRIATDSRPMAS